ncbi:MAG TPA: SDR family NAD(P)-dependent oxidoreductase [Abditibacterium sp.]|jgi:NAD(P)-dependent dehydrogenase (short-subunit alcohol dehydrogenase family)
MEPKTALVTGANHGLGFALTSGLLEQGWRVFAGRYDARWSQLEELQKRFPDTLHLVSLDVADSELVSAAAREVAALSSSLDLLLSNAAVFTETSYPTIRHAQNYDEMLRLYNVNTLGALRVVEAFLPLLDAGEMKRLCFVSSEAGSLTRAHRGSWFGYCQSKAALNMAARLLFNDLRPQGFSFRLYHPGSIRSYMHGAKNQSADLEPEEAAIPALNYFLNLLDDEDRLVMRDERGQEWPW